LCAGAADGAEQSGRRDGDESCSHYQYSFGNRDRMEAIAIGQPVAKSTVPKL
jgi:hypothetical protein